MLLVILSVIAGLSAAAAFFSLGMVIGVNLSSLRTNIVSLRGDITRLQKSQVEEKPVETETAVVDQRVVSAKKAYRKKHNINLEDPEDDGSESQIVTSRTAAQRKAESSAAREARLDKWMPGVKHDA